jgi:hypothetical protein
MRQNDLICSLEPIIAKQPLAAQIRRFYEREITLDRPRSVIASRSRGG